MDAGSETPRRLLFRVRLSPARSLSEGAFRRLMIAVAAISFVIGVATFLAGAWPVFGFMGLDVLLVYLAFRASFRRGRISETIELDQERLTVERIDVRGQSLLWRFQPAWLRVELPVHDLQPAPLLLRSHGQTLAIGAFLGPEQRAEVATDLRAALDRWRRPGPLTGFQASSPSTSRIE